MSDETITALLARAASRVPDSAPPVAELLDRGRREVRRRRAGVVGAAVVASLVVAGGGVALNAGTGHDHSSPAVVEPVPAPPAGTRWVGIGRTVFAVPDDHVMWPGLLCQSRDGHPHVTIARAGVTVSCPAYDPGIPEDPRITLTDDHGRISVSGGGDAVRDSRRTLPRDWVAVPAAIPAGRVGEPTAEEETRALERAGFRVIRRTGSPWTGPGIMTEPGIGEPARVGSTVTVIEKGPATAAASLRGRLLWTGGPHPGTSRAHAGTIHLVGNDNGVDTYVPTEADGRWSFNGPAGTYTITGSSPGYLSAGGEPDSCAAGRPVRARLSMTASVDVECLIR